jgi:hypothetical protein
MIAKSRINLIVIAIFLALIMFFGNKHISEAQSARYYLNWTIDCAKGESISIIPKYDLTFDWKDPYTGVVEQIVPLELSCKTNVRSVRKICNGYITTRASRLDPMNKTHATCYAVP